LNNVLTCSGRVNPAARRPDMRVHFQPIDEQHDGSGLEVGVAVQSQDVGVVLLFLEEQAQFGFLISHLRDI